MIVAAYRIIRPEVVYANKYFINAVKAVTSPEWVVNMYQIIDILSNDILNWEDLRDSRVINLIDAIFRYMFPWPLRRSSNVSKIPLAIAAAAAAKALRGEEAPDPVSRAVAAIDEASVIEAQVGDHKVTMEGYLLEGLAHDALVMAEILADMMELADILERYGRNRPLLALRTSRAKRASEDRLAAARLISRIFMAKERLLAAVTAREGVELEAEHREHGRAVIELPKPAIVTVTSNPAIVFETRQLDI